MTGESRSGGARKRRLFLNGRFLASRVTGVQRFAREIVRALDARLGAAGETLSCTLIAPRDASCASLGALENIEFETCGSFEGHLWEQTELLGRTAGGVLLSLCNSGPVCHPRQLVVIHDAAVFRHPEYFRPAYARLHQFMGRLLKNTARIATVSQFSREELSELLRLSAERILVVPNAWQHVLRLEADPSVLDRLGLNGVRFFLTVGNQTQHKNVGLAIEAVQGIAPEANAKLVVVGGELGRTFSTAATASTTALVNAGPTSDEQLAALYQRAEALVFPSLYEGFGVPPIEAMAFGCPVLASSIDPLKETCGDAAEYFNPRDPIALREKLIAKLASARNPALTSKMQERLSHYSWDRSADIIFEAMVSMALT